MELALPRLVIKATVTNHVHRIIPQLDIELASGFDKRGFIENTKSYFGLTKMPLYVTIRNAEITST